MHFEYEAYFISYNFFINVCTRFTFSGFIYPKGK